MADPVQVVHSSVGADDDSASTKINERISVVHGGSTTRTCAVPGVQASTADAAYASAVNAVYAHMQSSAGSAHTYADVVKGMMPTR